MERLKLIEEASGKYLQGTGISEMLNPQERAEMRICWSKTKSSENLWYGTVFRTVAE